MGAENSTSGKQHIPLKENHKINVLYDSSIECATYAISNGLLISSYREELLNLQKLWLRVAYINASNRSEKQIIHGIKLELLKLIQLSENKKLFDLTFKLKTLLNAINEYERKYYPIDHNVDS